MQGERSSFLALLPLIAIMAVGQNIPVTTTISENSSAEITDFSVGIGSVVNFFLQ